MTDKSEVKRLFILGIDVVAPEFMVLQPSKIIESLRNDTETVFPCAFCKIPYGNSYERAKHELLCKKRYVHAYFKYVIYTMYL